MVHFLLNNKYSKVYKKYTQQFWFYGTYRDYYFKIIINTHLWLIWIWLFYVFYIDLLPSKLTCQLWMDFISLVLNECSIYFKISSLKRTVGKHSNFNWEYFAAIK